MLEESVLKAPLAIFQHLDLVWTFYLLFVRYLALIMIIPGLGMGMRGVAIRTPGAMLMAFVSLSVSKRATLPPDYVQIMWTLLSEISFGFLIGCVPYLVVNAAQMAGQLTSNTMGLAAANLIDPSQGLGTTPLSLLLGNLVILIFLFMGGHHVVLYVASGLSGTVAPGTLIPLHLSIELLVEKSALIFESGFILAAPVIVALLLTQFVMGLISKAVSTVNIFIVSFPLTIGIGLIITALSLPAFIAVISKQIAGIEGILMVIVKAMMS